MKRVVVSRSWHGFAPIPQLSDPGCKGGTCAWPKRKALLFTNNAEYTVGMRINITLRASFGASHRPNKRASNVRPRVAERRTLTHCMLCDRVADDGKTWPTQLPIGPRLPAVPNSTNGLSGPGGYSDVILHEHAGQDWAAVIFEESDPNSCAIKVAIVDPVLLLPKDGSTTSLKSDDTPSEANMAIANYSVPSSLPTNATSRVFIVGGGFKESATPSCRLSASGWSRQKSYSCGVEFRISKVADSGSL